MSSDCSSIPDAKFFNDKYTYPVWFTRKKMVFHNKMLKRLKKLRFLHSRSSQYYESMNIRLSAPSIVITALSGIASFLSTSQYVDEDAQNACGITVGVLASAASVFQAFAAACQYGAKKEAHRTVAEQYNALIVKTKFEMEMPNEEDFIDKLEAAILEIDAKCNYFVPQFIIKEWEAKESRNLETKPKSNHDNSDSLNIGLFDADNEVTLESSQNLNLNIRDSIKKQSVNENSYLLQAKEQSGNTDAVLTQKRMTSLDYKTDFKNKGSSINVERDDIVLNIPAEGTVVTTAAAVTESNLDLSDDELIDNNPVVIDNQSNSSNV